MEYTGDLAGGQGGRWPAAMECSSRDAHTIFDNHTSSCITFHMDPLCRDLVLPLPTLTKDVICTWFVLCGTFKWFNPLLLHLFILFLSLFATGWISLSFMMLYDYLS